MDNYAITISRQFASLGRSIAQELSEILDIDFLDRDIVEETAKRMNQPVSLVSKEEEDITSPFAYRMYPLGIGVPSMKDEIFNVQQSIITDVASKKSCIIVGRCGSYCLRNHPRLLKVYVYASVEDRLKNCIERLGMQEKEALRAIAEVDAARENYHKTYIKGYKSPTLDSDICINSGTYSIEEAALLIKDALALKVGL